MPRFNGYKVLLLCACTVIVVASVLIPASVTRAQDATPGAPPSGTDLGLGALVYQADFTDAKAWPAISVLDTRMTSSAGSYNATSTGKAMAFSPSTAYRGRDYYAEMSITLKDCTDDGTLYFVTHITQDTVDDGDSFSYTVACDGSIVARRISGGELRLSSGTSALKGSFKPGQHTLGIFMSGMRAKLYVDGQPAGSIASATMPQIGRVAFGVSGNISLTVDQLRIWSLAADNVPQEAGKLLYDADFQDDLQWLDGMATDSLSRVADQTYLINTIGKPFAPLSGKIDASDVVVVEDVSMRHCDTDGSVGMVIHAGANLSGAYAFVLQCDGNLKAGPLNSQTKLIDKSAVGYYGTMGKIDSSESSLDAHRLALVAHGRSMMFYVDGDLVGSIADDTFTADSNGNAVSLPEPTGDVGLYAAPSSDGQQTIASIETLTVWAIK